MTAEIEAGAAARLDVTLGQLARKIDTLMSVGSDPFDTPQFPTPITKTATATAGGVAQVSLGGPNLGYYWMVRRVSISDAAAWSNTMGSAIGGFYLCRSGATLVPLPQQIAWPFAVLPNVATFSTNHLRIGYGDHLVLYLTGCTSGQVIQATAYAELATVRQRKTIMVD